MTGQQLKNSILQMAIQGKLVPQDPNDEPASVLIERIRKEKEQLIKEGKIKKEKNPSYIFRGPDNLPYEKVENGVRSLADLAPFEIPPSWEWCRVGDLFSSMSGLAYKKSTLAIRTDKMVRVLRGGNIGEEQFVFKDDDIFISSEFVKPELYLRKNYMITPAVSSLNHIGKIALIDRNYSDAVVGGFVLMLIPHFNDDVVSKYLLYAFAAKHHRDNCRNITHKSGQAFYNLSREQMMNLPVPIPPREEMERIIAVLEQAFPKITDYAAVNATLKKLNDSFPETLKKSILQEAIQGKLVPQDPNDEPASVLLERIREEKQRLIKEGKIKKDKHESIIFRRDNSYYEKLDGVERCIDDELPFEIPDGWEWCRLKSIVNIVSARRVHQSDWQSEGVPFYRAREIGKLADTGHVENDLYITEALYAKLASSGVPHSGDLMITAVGTLGKAYIVKDDDRFYYKDASVICFENFSKVCSAYLKILMCSPYMEDQIKQNSSGTTVSTITIVKANEYLIPLPPLKEQERIVDQIDCLQQYINNL